MALTECRECGKEVSTEARACPNCGIPRPGAESIIEGDCRGCGRYIQIDPDDVCPHCRTEYPLSALLQKEGSSSSGDRGEKSDTAAGCLGLFLGPVGLWYKGKWAAGFAWLAMAVVIGGATGGIAAPFFWIGMAIHAYAADAQ